MTQEQIKSQQDNWKNRRRVVQWSVAGLMAMLGYLTVFGEAANVVQSTLAQVIPFGIVGIVLTYVAGPVADDFLQLKINKS